jgi:hypothetical protein
MCCYQNYHSVQESVANISNWPLIVVQATICCVNGFLKKKCQMAGYNETLHLTVNYQFCHWKLEKQIAYIFVLLQKQILSSAAYQSSEQSFSKKP